MNEAPKLGRALLEEQGFSYSSYVEWSDLREQFERFSRTNPNIKELNQSYFSYETPGDEGIPDPQLTILHRRSNSEPYYSVMKFYLSEDGRFIIIPRMDGNATILDMEMETNGVTLSILKPGGEDVITLYPEHSIYDD